MSPTALIADDEPQLIVNLKLMLTELWPQLEIVAIAHTGRQALELIEQHHPDIAFLDIKMPELSGLEVASKVDKMCRLVFVTAYDNYALEAFERAAVDYLLKPIEEERLMLTIERLKAALQTKQALPDLTALLQQLAQTAKGTGGALRWIKASVGNNIHLIPIEDIVYFKADDKYTIIRTQAGEFLARFPIRDLLLQLNPNQFWQINRGIIVNTTQITIAQKNYNGTMQLKLKDCPDVLPVSKAFVHLFK